MKLFFVLVMFCFGFLVSCDDCARVHCENGGKCDEGECRCSDGNSRTLCLIDTCFEQNSCLNGHCEYGFCVCAANWEGKKCDIEIYTDFSGKYDGSFECSNYGESGTIVVTKTSEFSVFTFREEKYDYVYEVNMTSKSDFEIKYQEINGDSSGLFVVGNGHIVDSKLMMNVKYQTVNQQITSCDYLGTKTQF